MLVKLENGVFELDNGKFVLQVAKDHTILNVDAINRYFNVKIPTSHAYTLDRLLQHQQIREYSELYSYLTDALESINSDHPIIIYEEPRRIEPLLQRPIDLTDAIASMKTIIRCISILIIIWIIVIIITITKTATHDTTTLNLEHRLYTRNEHLDHP